MKNNWRFIWSYKIFLVPLHQQINKIKIGDITYE